MAWKLLLLCFALRLAGASGLRLITHDPRIVGGLKTSIQKYPFMVDIHKNNRHHCGGTLLKRDVVLTASHCVYNVGIYNSKGRYEVYCPHQLRVVVGATFSILQKVGKPTVRNVSFIHAHPEFKFPNMQNDIALLQLSRPVNLSHEIQLVNISSHDPSPGTVCIALGWGILHRFGANKAVAGKLEDALHVVDLPIISLDECRRNVPLATNQHLCIYNVSKDVCVGDSGGPLMCEGKQVGITSFGKGCAAQGYPGVFQKVFIHDVGALLSRSAQECGGAAARARPRPRPRAPRRVLPAVVVALAALPLPLPLPLPLARHLPA